MAKKEKNEEAVEKYEETEIEENESKEESESEDNGIQLSADDEKALLDQVSQEIETAKDFMRSRNDEILKRFKIYNNQKKDKDRVGDPLFFTLHQTLLASLFDDRFNVTFGRSDKLIKAEKVAMSDYDEMDMDWLEYLWDWNTLFYGRACVLMMTFDREEMTPQPQLLDPILFLRDPKASSPNGGKYGRAARYLGRAIELSRYEIKESGLYNEDALDKEDGESKSYMNDSTIRRLAQARDEAQNRGDSTIDTGIDDNKIEEAVEWFTHFKGKKCFVTVTVGCKGVLRYEVLKNQKRWPIADKACFPIPGDWDGVSVADLAEDKQRAKAILINLAFQSLLADIEPQRIYDASRITNRADLQNGGDIAINGDINNAIASVPSSTPNLSLFDYVSNYLDNSSQKATATPEIQQGTTSKDQRTLGELNLIASKVDTRYSLLAKLFSMGLKRFWEMWYELYDEYMIESDEKEIETGDEYSEGSMILVKSDFISDDNRGLKIKVNSKMLEDAKRMRGLQNFSQYFQIAMQMPNANKGFIIRKLGKMFGIETAELDLMLPRDIEELKAEAENKGLNENREVIPGYDENHNVHLSIHAYAEPTPATIAHIEAHKNFLTFQREFDINAGNMEGMQQQPQGEQQQGQMQEPNARSQSTDASVSQVSQQDNQASQQLAQM